MRSSLLQVALNGSALHDHMPRSPDETADDAAASVEAGANAIHLHAFDDDGVETFEDRYVARTLRAVRRRCPGVPVNMTTFAEIEPDPARRLAQISAWTELPDLIPANQGEQGVDDIAGLLASRGVGIEACLLSVDDARAFVDRPDPVRYERIFVEPMDEDPARAVADAEQMNRVLDAADVTLERVFHGAGTATWDVLRWAAARGHGLRAGLEDTDRLPDGSRAGSNAELVAAAARIRDDARA
ncbi:3-keto-5-aminohexanoate cleavage protein [Solicola sp. PLA-1-18]|uniref:3-keto-5-aminohexanoate cleavage protein n=1 Tax=Solicola sp. PLA-1-18 TaxID=3380532 RepID=UPI003B8236B5